MPVEAIAAVGVFAALFTMWVVLPSKFRAARSGRNAESEQVGSDA